MNLPESLVKEFATIINKDDKKTTDVTAYGTIKNQGGNLFVVLDGSDALTPIESTTEIKDGERVLVLIKNHTATVTGNTSNPSASTGSVNAVKDEVLRVSELVAGKISAQEADLKYATVENLNAEKGRIDTLETSKLSATEADLKYATITNLNAEKGRIDTLETSKLSATEADLKYATVENLNAEKGRIDTLETSKLSADEADLKYATITNLNAEKGRIDTLETSKLDADSAKVMYMDINFANIGLAQVEKLFSTSGIIKDIKVEDASISGELVGVTIKGDLIEGGTVVADKLVVKGQNGIYYKLNVDGETVEKEQTNYNSLNGSIITAKTITASKITVSDLVAFGADIGGFHIGQTSIYSGAKATMVSTSSGIHLESDGQMNIGNDKDFIKFYKDTYNKYKLSVSASSVVLTSTGKTVEDSIKEVDDKLSKYDTSEQVNSKITQSANNIKSEVSQTYATNEYVSNKVDKEDYMEYQNTIQSQFEQTANDMQISFSQSVQDAKDYTDNQTSDTTTGFQELMTYIKLDSNGITIGKNENRLTLQLSNDAILFLNDGQPIGSWDGTNFHTGNIVIDVNQRAQFGNFAYVPRSDGSLMFLKVK